MAPQSGLALERQQLLQQYFDESAQAAIREKYSVNLLEENKIWLFPRWGGLRTNPYRLSDLGLKLFDHYANTPRLDVNLLDRHSFLPVIMSTTISKNLLGPYYVDTYRLILFGETDKTWALMYDLDVQKLYKAVA